MILFENAIERNLENPDTFFLPEKYRINSLVEKDFVKVCSGNERFWVKLTKVDLENDILKGYIDNDLINKDIHGLSYKDNVEFKKENIFDIL